MRYSTTSGADYTLCPFFKGHSRREILCEAHPDRCVCVMRFETAGEKEQHKQTYCDMRYRYCEHYISLIDYKYSEED